MVLPKSPKQSSKPGLFRACLQLQISFGLGPDSDLYFRARGGFESDLVGPFTTLLQSTPGHRINSYT